MVYRTTSVVKLILMTATVAMTVAVVPPAHAMTASGEAQTSGSLVNAARRNGGLATLPVDPRLQRIAQKQSERMAAQGTIYHNNELDDEVTAAGIDWRWVGENVGVGPDAKLIHDGFMHSPHHYEVLMHAEGNAFGIGAAISKDGRLYITQVYAKIVSSRPVAVSAPMRTAPQPVRAAPPRPAPRKVVAPSDPNAVIDGVVRHDVFRLIPRASRGINVTRSGLRAS